MTRARVRMIDVARAAGVSRATVSFVLNDTPGQKIRPETADRVRAAATELGYVPSALALALQSGMSDTVVVITGRVLGGHSLEGFLRGLETELTSHGQHLLVVNGRGPTGVPREVLDVIAPRAVIDLGQIYAADDAPEWEGGDVSGMRAHSLTQLRHLADSGHRRIAIVVPDDDHPFVARRTAHLRDAAARLDLSVVAVTREHDLAHALPHVHSEGATAIAAFSDDTAIVVLSHMAELGLRAPEDLAVMGFDDSRHGALWRPALTTVAIDAESYGRRAARRVLALADEATEVAYSRVIRRDSA